MAETEELAARALKELGRELQGGHRHGCLLMVDPTLRPIDTQQEEWRHCANLSAIPVPSLHERIDPAVCPVLLPLKRDVEGDAALLAHSVREALQELRPDLLREGHGRRIGGWISTAARAEDVALHLARLSLQRRTDGRASWLRLHDPAVLWVLWGWLQPAQRAALLGPMDGIYVVNPAGTLQPLTTSEPLVDDRLRLTEPQWAAIDCMGPLNAALRDWGALLACQPERLRTARGQALAAIQRARRLGFEDARDLAFYGLCALEVHPRFDFHPLIVQQLRARRPQDYFSGLVADIQPNDWQRIARESPSIQPDPHGAPDPARH